MRIYIYEKRKIKYISLIDFYSLDIENKIIYLKLKRAKVLNTKYEKVKVKKDKVKLYFDKVNIFFNY